MVLKQLNWVGSTRRRFKGFPKTVRREAGFQLWRVQKGEEPYDWKSLRAVGTGVKELQIHKSQEYRVIYIDTFFEAIYALHAFGKKTRVTPLRDLQIARSNYASIQKERQKY